MHDLLEKIETGFEYRKAFSFFSSDIEEITGGVFDLDPEIRGKLEAFAAQNGWEVEISGIAVRAIFRKKENAKRSDGPHTNLWEPVRDRAQGSMAAPIPAMV